MNRDVIAAAIKSNQKNALSSLFDFFRERLPRVPDEKKETVTKDIKSWIKATYQGMDDRIKNLPEVKLFIGHGDRLIDRYTL